MVTLIGRIQVAQIAIYIKKKRFQTLITYCQGFKNKFGRESGPFKSHGKFGKHFGMTF